MTEDDSTNITKRLSDESQYLLEELGRISTSAADLVPRLYKSLEDDGLEHSEIFHIIQEKMDLSRRRLYDLIPEEKKRPYKKVQKLHNQKPEQPQARLVTDEPPKVPPPPQVIQEVEPEPDGEQVNSPSPRIIPTPTKAEPTAIIPTRRFTFIELNRAMNWATSNGIKYLEIGVKDNKIEIL